jgi:hypothetical protein
MYITGFREISPPTHISNFTWGEDSQIIYSCFRERTLIYLYDLKTKRTHLVSLGRYPTFRKPKPPSECLSSIYFLRSSGHGDGRELWRYSIYPNYRGESKVSNAVIDIFDEIYLSPSDDTRFAYRYSVCMADGGFKQVRLTKVGRYPHNDSETRVLYSQELGSPLPLPTISGWLDDKHLVCFLDDIPYILSVEPGILIDSKSRGFPVNPADWDKLKSYPNDGKLLHKGLNGFDRVIIPGSNFAPDGLSYIVYSEKENRLIQRSLKGEEISSVSLPIEFEPRYYIRGDHPRFSRDGRHICFIGLKRSKEGRAKSTLWIADVRWEMEEGM